MKKALLGVLLLVLLAGVIACGQPGDPLLLYNSDPDSAVPESRSYGSVSSGSGIRVPAPTPTLPPTIRVTIPPAPDASYYGEVPQERMVIKTAYLALVVEDVSASMV